MEDWDVSLEFVEAVLEIDRRFQHLLYTKDANEDCVHE